MRRQSTSHMLLRPAYLMALIPFVFAAPETAAQSPDGPRHDYIGSDACIACHKDQGDAWRGSHHDLAWTEPTSETVLGDFSDATFTHQGITHRFTTTEDGYFIETDGPDAAMTTYRIEGVAGVEPLQQYLVETGPGRLQSHDVAWDREEERWFHLYPGQRLKAGDGLHWMGPYKTWNARCAECHATGYEKAFDARTGVYRSTQAEIGVGCESCHGPGSRHRDWAEAGVDRTGVENAGLAQQFTQTNPQAEIQQCAGCHSRREPFLGGNPIPGTAFHDAYRLALLRPGLYHADGAILDEVYVYGSFLQSKMYANGVRCSDCHDPHRAELKVAGNAICTQCHSLAGNARFPSLRTALYDGPEHHFHPEGDGAACVSCHMVARTYMQVDPRRDHSFRVPRPDLSAETGAPNACTDCHAERDAGWAAQVLSQRFTDSRHRGPHFSQTLAAGRMDPASNANALLDLARSGEPGIVRATALELLQSAANEGHAQKAAVLLADEDPLVRAAAIGLQRTASPRDRVARVWPLLNDPRRNVRMAAARAFLDMPRNTLVGLDLAELQTVSGEWRASLIAKTDFPETHLVLGGTALGLRDFRSADAAFSEVVRLDPNQVDGWVMLVRIRDALGDRKGAQQALDQALMSNPTDFDLLMLERQIND